MSEKQLFKLNNQIVCDQSNTTESMFTSEKASSTPTESAECVVAATYTVDAHRNDFHRHIRSLRDEIAQLEQVNNGESDTSTLRQIDLAVKYMTSCMGVDNIQSFVNLGLSTKSGVEIVAISSKSLFEVLVGVQYASVMSNEITVLFDEKRKYLLTIFESIFKSVRLSASPRTCVHHSSYCSQIIFDTADFQSAFATLAAAFSDNTAPWKIRSCWIQDTLRVKFHTHFQSYLNKTPDLSVEAKLQLENILEKSRQYDASIIRSEDANSTFVVGVTKKHIDTDLCVLINFFRTAKEAVSLVKSTDNTNTVSLWSENISLVYDVANKLEVENCWINCNGILNPEVPFTFCRGADKHIYGSKFGLVQMVNSPKESFHSRTRHTYSSATTTTNNYNFQTTCRPKDTAHVSDGTAIGYDSIEEELKYLIDVNALNTFKTICFPFGKIFVN